MTRVVVRKRWRQSVIDGVQSKRCRACGGWFPATPEHFHRKGHGALHSECRPCGRAIASAYQRARYVPRPQSYDPRIRDVNRQLFVRRFEPTADDIAAIETAAEQFLAEVDAMFNLFTEAA